MKSLVGGTVGRASSVFQGVAPWYIPASAAEPFVGVEKRNLRLDRAQRRRMMLLS
jgi:hypothetical protein